MTLSPYEAEMKIVPYEAKMLLNALRWGDPALHGTPHVDLEELKEKLAKHAALFPVTHWQG